MARVAATISPSPSLVLPAWLKQHPRHWQAGTIDRDGLQAAAQALVAHPEFDAACIDFIDAWQASFEAHQVTQRVIRDAAWFVLIAFAMYLHHQRDPADPMTGITAGGLQALYAQNTTTYIVAKPSRVKAMLARLVSAGLLRSVQPVGGVADKRVKPLEPTATLEAFCKGRIMACLQGSARLLPSPANASQAISSAVACEIFSYGVGAFVHERFGRGERYPAVMLFMRRERGYQVFLLMMRSLQFANGQWQATVSAYDLAKRLGVSRSTVRNLLEQAQKLGLLQRSAGSQQVVLAPQFAASARRWLAQEMLWMHTLASAAVLPTPRQKISRHLEPSS